MSMKNETSKPSSAADTGPLGTIDRTLRAARELTARVSALRVALIGSEVGPASTGGPKPVVSGALYQIADHAAGVRADIDDAVADLEAIFKTLGLEG